jgi:hypothetical protein
VYDLDIEKNKYMQHAIGNMLIQKFNHCSDPVKLRLFQRYCINFYWSQLWYNYKLDTQQRLKVASNNIFRTLMGIKRKSSISGAFVNSGVDGYSSVIRRFSYSFYNRIMQSNSSLVCKIMTSVYLTHFRNCFIEINNGCLHTECEHV